MKIWTDGYNTFEDEDAARDNACAEMTWDDYEEYFRNNVNFHDFFTRVRERMQNSDEFFFLFENEFCDAMNEYFNNNYWEEEGEEEDEEEEDEE